MKGSQVCFALSRFLKRHHAVTEFWRADEVSYAAHTAVVFPLRLVELHADPLTAGELCGPTKPQSAGLRGRGGQRDRRLMLESTDGRKVNRFDFVM